MRKWDAVLPGELDVMIEYLKQNFDPDMSRKVIEVFHERMQDDEHVDLDALYSLMKHVFAQIVAGKSADQAFGLKRIKGKYQRPDTYERDIRAAAIVVLKLRQGLKWLYAIGDAALALDVSESTVKRAYDDFREGFEWLPDEILQQIAGDQKVSP